MNRSRSLPARLIFYLAGLFGVARTTRTLAAEAGAPEESIHPDTRFEPQDINAKAVLLVGIGILLAIWALVLALYPFFDYLSYSRTGGRDPSKVLAYIPSAPPKPRNEHAPFIRLKEYRDREKAALNTYQWVDRNKGTISIPIARAIELLAKEGIPPSKPGGKEYQDPNAGSMLTGFENKVEPPPR